MISIAPLLIIVIAIAGLVFGQDAARGEIVAHVQGLIGRDGAIAVQGLLKSTSEPVQGIVAIAISAIMIIIGATTVFAELQSDLDPSGAFPPRTNRGASSSCCARVCFLSA